MVAWFNTNRNALSSYDILKYGVLSVCETVVDFFLFFIQLLISTIEEATGEAFTFEQAADKVYHTLKEVNKSITI